jgi:hypothetical protein
MPRINDDILNCAIYFYPSVQAARDGEQSGGCGFWIGMPTIAEFVVPNYDKPVPIWLTYAVTNKHVIDAGCHVLRVNKHDGTTEVAESSPDQWIVSVDDDLAVTPAVAGADLKIDFIQASRFVSKPEPDKRAEFGPGDEAVLIGRMIAHDGRQKNSPIARFGNIAMMSDDNEPVRLPTGLAQVGYLVECRSLPGTSGSAVLAYKSINRGDNTFVLSADARPWLLGVDCAHLPRWTDVYEADRSTKTGHRVEMNSGVAVVIPAWRLLDLLNRPELVEERRLRESALPNEIRNGDPPNVART